MKYMCGRMLHIRVRVVYSIYRVKRCDSISRYTIPNSCRTSSTPSLPALTHLQSSEASELQPDRDARIWLTLVWFIRF